jgi:DNA polymerase-3 subunit delta
VQVRADALDAALARALPRAVWVHGDEPLLVQEATDSARRALRAAGFDEREVFTADRSFRVEALIAEAQSLSLFAANRLLEVRLPGRPGRELGQGLADTVAALPDSTRLLVSGPRLDRASTESAWFGAFDRHALVVAVYPVERGRLPDWIGQRLARQKQRADPDTLRFVAERVEGNLLAAHQEIQKLGLLFPEGALPGDAVRQAVLNVARYDAFGLAEAMLAGDTARTLRSLDGLRAEGEPEPLVLWAIADAIRSLARLVEARDAGRPPASLMRELRIFPPRDRAYEQALRRVDAPLLSAALQQAARIDRMIKGRAAGEPWAAMVGLVALIAGAPALQRES